MLPRTITSSFAALGPISPRSAALANANARTVMTRFPFPIPCVLQSPPSFFADNFPPRRGAPAHFLEKSRPVLSPSAQTLRTDLYRRRAKLREPDARSEGDLEATGTWSPSLRASGFDVSTSAARLVRSDGNTCGK